eukprot:SAG31_NODE_488_length_14964_cov_56.443458_15_plen_126_part_00
MPSRHGQSTVICAELIQLMILTQSDRDAESVHYVEFERRFSASTQRLRRLSRRREQIIVSSAICPVLAAQTCRAVAKFFYRLENSIEQHVITHVLINGATHQPHQLESCIMEDPRAVMGAMMLPQ